MGIGDPQFGRSANQPPSRRPLPKLRINKWLAGAIAILTVIGVYAEIAPDVTLDCQLGGNPATDRSLARNVLFLAPGHSLEVHLVPGVPSMDNDGYLYELPLIHDHCTVSNGGRLTAQNINLGFQAQFSVNQKFDTNFEPAPLETITSIPPGGSYEFYIANRSAVWARPIPPTGAYMEIPISPHQFQSKLVIGRWATAIQSGFFPPVQIRQWKRP